MKSSRGRSIFIVAGVFTLAITVSALFSLAQLGPLDPLTPLATPINLLADVTNRIPDIACPNCFKVANTYGIHEEVPGTGFIILREIPDPAPLLPGKRRLEFDEEGSPIWYVGDQGIVGPTDEDPVSAELPVPKIELRRIQARQEGKIFGIPGVHSFGISARGFIVSLEPKYLQHESRIPAMIEGIPLEVEVVNVPTFRANISDLFRRPVEIGLGITVPERGGTVGVGRGTVGPHIVRNEAQPGILFCCQIWSLTAAHVVKTHISPPPTPGTRAVYQPSASSPGNLWGYVAHSWSQVRCDTPTDPNCTRPDRPINFTDQNPDVAAIAHIDVNHFDTHPHKALTDPEDTNGGASPSRSPIRRMRHGRSPGDYVSGPSGLIRTPSIGAQLKMWGSTNSASNTGRVSSIDRVVRIIDRDDPSRKFLYCCIDIVDLIAEDGDSGALVAYDGTGSRHVASVAFAGLVDGANNPIVGTLFTKAFDIQGAFINAGQGFAYYWGTKENNRSPANSECDGGC